jgi:hypothetical protein
MSSDGIVKLTRRGRRAMRKGLDGLSPGVILWMEVMSRVGGTTYDNASDLIEELLERYGSAEEAIVALKSGKVGFEKDAAPEATAAPTSSGE